MICYRETGQRGDALAVFQRCREILAQQFHIDPSAKTLDLYLSLKS